MPKVVYTDGMLCRDSTGGGLIVFFSKCNRAEVYQRNQMWWSEDIEGPEAKEWTLKDWKATYDLAPPRKGRCFECEVEL